MFLKKDNRIFVLDSIEELMKLYSFKKKGRLVEEDLDIVKGVEDINGRKKMDALVISTISANLSNAKMLDIGTYHGKSATRMAINSPTSQIYTVNILLKEEKKGGKLNTEILQKDKIGSFFKEKKIKNIEQYYANTATWDPPQKISKLSMSYIDGCHDKEFVYSDSNLVYPRTKENGYILWHDFSPQHRRYFSWINQSMLGVEKFFRKQRIRADLFIVKNSWIGIWKKQ